MLVILAVGAVRSPAAAAAGWEDLADTIFRPIGQSTEAPAILLPTAIAQDGAGFLWVGGESGLARWDGYRYRLYTSDAQQPDGLTDHNILALHADRAGRLWVGTVSGGLARYDPAADRFATVPLQDHSGRATCVWSIDDDGAGGEWIGTSTGVFHLDAGGRLAGSLHHDGARAGSLPGDKVQAVLIDRQGVLWVGGAFGVAHGIDANASFVAVPLPASRSPAEISHMMQDRAGRLWLGSRQQGAFMIDAARGAAVAVPGTQEAPGETAAEILAMAEITPGKIWLGTYGNGIVDVDAATLHARRILHNPFVSASLPANTVTALFRDRSGLAWAGTSNGLSLYDPGNGGIMTLWGDPDRKDGLRVKDASAVLVRPDGALWVGSEGDGLQVLGPAGQARGIIAVKRVFALAASQSGPVYVGSRSGLYAADPASLSLTPVVVPDRPAGAGVNALLVQDGVLWVGGGEDGVWGLLPRADGGMTTVLHLDQPVLTNGTARAISLAPDGRLAVGTDRGFNLVDRASGAVERILSDPADPDGLSPGAVMSFAIDRNGRLWVGTDSTGINVLIGRDAAGRPRFRHIGRAEGLPNDDVSRMLVDRNGMIWASTDVGLATIDPGSFAVRALQTLDGVVVPTYWSNSGDTTAQGELVFGGIGGLCIVRPALVRQWRYRPPVVITAVEAGGQVLQGAFEAVGEPATVTIPANHNSLTVDFSALDFSAPDLNRYAYRLAGFDSDWVQTRNGNHQAAYTNLPPGSYRLDLRGSNRDGVFSEHDSALRVIVEPAWFQTIWFRLAAGLAAVVMIGGLVQTRTMILQRRQRELERLVAERTAELSLSQEKLQQFAYFDSLTGLPNRRAFNEEFQALIDARPLEPFALILVDLDGFKKVNDSLGHLAGDALLVGAAVRLRQAIREQDFVARLGGDEFAILVRSARDAAPATTVCTRIVESMAEAMPVRGVSVLIGASAGAALFPRDGLTLDELYRHVDLALYEAKRAGRGVWRFYRDGTGRSSNPVSLPS